MLLGKGLVSQFKEKQLSEDKMTTKKNILTNIFLKLNKTEKEIHGPKEKDGASWKIPAESSKFVNCMTFPIARVTWL